MSDRDNFDVISDDAIHNVVRVVQKNEATAAEAGERVTLRCFRNAL